MSEWADDAFEVLETYLAGRVGPEPAALDFIRTELKQARTERDALKAMRPGAFTRMRNRLAAAESDLELTREMNDDLLAEVQRLKAQLTLIPESSA